MFQANRAAPQDTLVTAKMTNSGVSVLRSGELSSSSEGIGAAPARALAGAAASVLLGTLAWSAMVSGGIHTFRRRRKRLRGSEAGPASLGPARGLPVSGRGRPKPVGWAAERAREQ